MKIKLDYDGPIAVLDVLEDVSSENVKVLKAGVGKILQSGRNKIIVNLVEARNLPAEAMREIVLLHIVATELNGEIVLVGQGPLVKQTIQSFSVPPPVKYFVTVEAALSALKEEAKQKSDSKPAFDDGELAAQIKKLQEENKDLKAKVQGKGGGDIKKLYRENKLLQKMITTLESQISVLRKEKRNPYEMEGFAEKVKTLEDALKSSLSKEGVVRS